MSRQRVAARMIFSRFPRPLKSSKVLSRRRWLYATIAPRGLLISWATFVAMRPSEDIFSKWMSRDWIAFRSR